MRRCWSPRFARDADAQLWGGAPKVTSSGKVEGRAVMAPVSDVGGGGYAYAHSREGRRERYGEL